MSGTVGAMSRRLGRLAVAACLAVVATAFSVNRAPPPDGDPFVEATHMRMTTLTPPAPGDSARAAAVLSALRAGLAPYQDYHRALADGFRIFAPNVPQHVYHFTNLGRGLAAAFSFDPGQPTSLLYEKTGDSTYRLIGAMYTARKLATLADLDSRVPLSFAQWHMHTNWCLPKEGEMDHVGDRDPEGHRIYGGQGTITTEAACQAVGGRFYPTIFGWMVHVYPFATNPETIWGRDALHEMAGDHGMTEMGAGASSGAGESRK